MVIRLGWAAVRSGGFGGDLTVTVQRRRVGGGPAGIPAFGVAYPAGPVIRDAVAEHLIDRVVDGLGAGQRARAADSGLAPRPPPGVPRPPQPQPAALRSGWRKTSGTTGGTPGCATGRTDPASPRPAASRCPPARLAHETDLLASNPAENPAMRH